MVIVSHSFPCKLQLWKEADTTAKYWKVRKTKHEISTSSTHRKGRSQKKITPSCYLAFAKQALMKLNRALKTSSRPAFSLHIWEVTPVTSESMAPGHIIANGTEIKLQTWHFQHIIKDILARVAKCFWFFIYQPETPRNSDYPTFHGSKNQVLQLQGEGT